MSNSRLKNYIGVWSLECSGMWRRVVTLKFTDVSEVRTSFIIAQMMEAVRTSWETSRQKQNDKL
jgi:hypothetical protein